MDARDRWQALQARLTAARAAVDAGDRATALAEISAALELDKDFLAAQALRDRIMKNATAAPTQAAAPPAPIAPARVAAPIPTAPVAALPNAAAAAPGWIDGYAKFEQRARRRRVDRRVDAARAAMAQRRLKAAAAALDEVIELDPNLPELTELTAQFDALRRAAATPRRGPRIAAAAVFAGALLGGSWLRDTTRLVSRHDPTPLVSQPIVSAALLPVPLAPSFAFDVATTDDAVIDETPIEVGTSGTRVPPAAVVPAATVMSRSNAAAPPPAVAAVQPARIPDTVAAVQPARIPDAVTALSPSALRLPAIAVDTPPPPRPTESPAAVAANTVTAPAVTPVSKTPPTRLDPPEDEGMIKQVLQRYRKAYEGLDAQSAQAVWPAVNEAALARAFDGLSRNR